MLAAVTKHRDQAVSYKKPPLPWFLEGSCKKLEADFGSWTMDAGFCIIGLHRLDSTSAAGQCPTDHRDWQWHWMPGGTNLQI
jgi:hypothetical protein